MGVRAVDDIRALIDAAAADPAGLWRLFLRIVVQLDSHMEGADDQVRILLLQGVDRGNGLFLIGAIVAVGGVVLAVDAKPQTAGGRHDLCFVVLSEGNPVFLQRGPGVPLAGLMEILGVVVGRRDKVDAAFQQNVGGSRRCAEGEGLDRGEPLIREGALQVADRVFIVVKVLYDIGEGISEVAVHRAFKIHRHAGGTGQREVTDKADGKGFRLGLRRGLRRRFRRGFDRGFRRRFRHGNNGRRAFDRGGPFVDIRGEKRTGQIRAHKNKKAEQGDGAQQGKRTKQLFHLFLTSLQILSF